MPLSKSAQTKYDIHPILNDRWSPRAFADKKVEQEKIQRFFEAARWTPSSSNEQPWRFIIGFKGDETYQKIYDTFVEFNQLWAFTAPVLILTIGNTRSVKNPEKPNLAYAYDCGQAVAHLTFQAAADGLFVHQMGGFDTDQAAKTFGVPESFKVLTAIAIGYIGDPEVLHPNLKQMEYSKRERQNLDQMVFSGRFGNVAPEI